MYISKFHVENFKSFKSVIIHLNDKVNVLTGSNNTGKSTLLEAIALWHECYEKLLKRAGKATKKIYKQDDYTFGVEAGSYFAYSEIISVRSPYYEDIFHNLNKKNGAVILRATLSDEQGKNIDINFKIVGADGGNYKISLENYNNFDYSLFNDRVFIKNPETAIKTLYASPIANVLSVEEWQHYRTIEHKKQSHASFQVIRNRLYELNSRNYSNAFDKFQEQLSVLLFENPGQVKFNFEKDKGPFIKVLLQLGYEVSKDISLYGSGTLQLIEILLNIHEQKNEMNIVLLDEPDSHIHRQLQSRLLRILNASDNTQVFITTHNESLIRESNPNWIFHLEQLPEKEYFPIQRNRQGNRGLMSSPYANIIQTLSGKGSGLDFVTALEADVLFMVEGVNDALRIQKILSLRNNDMRKYAYWVMGSIDTILDQIAHYKNVFTNIENEKSLWDKTVLILDKDYLTDKQRSRLISEFQTKLKLKKIHIWESYCFDSVVFSDLALLSTLLTNFTQEKNTKKPVTYNEISSLLKTALNKLIDQKNNSNKVELMNLIKGEKGKKGKKFEHLGFQKIYEPEFDVKEAIAAYLDSCFNEKNIHKLMNKDDCEMVFQEIFASFGIPFSMEWIDEQTFTFNDIIETINIGTLFPAWDFLINKV